MRSILITIFMMVCYSVKGWTQLSPPGMGKGHSAYWSALGISQRVGAKAHNWNSVSYVGYGRKSSLSNNNPLYIPAILVLNEELAHRIDRHWKYSVGLSYRRENEYTDTAAYELTRPEVKQELRLYNRFSYTQHLSGVKLAVTLRQELRQFYTGAFLNTRKDFQFRERFRVQMGVHLDRKRRHRLSASAEQLFSVSKAPEPEFWTDFAYRESRFALYYTYAPDHLPLQFHAGYMYNMVGGTEPYHAHYFACDIVVVNPADLLHSAKQKG